MGVTISDIAEIAGVSKSLVSNYINGKFDNMSENTQDKIKSVIKELNYIPDNKHRNFKNSQRGQEQQQGFFKHAQEKKTFPAAWRYGAVFIMYILFNFIYAFIISNAAMHLLSAYSTCI